MKCAYYMYVSFKIGVEEILSLFKPHLKNERRKKKMHGNLAPVLDLGRPVLQRLG